MRLGDLPPAPFPGVARLASARSVSEPLQDGDQDLVADVRVGLGVVRLFQDRKRPAAEVLVGRVSGLDRGEGRDVARAVPESLFQDRGAFASRGGTRLAGGGEEGRPGLLHHHLLAGVSRDELPEGFHAVGLAPRDPGQGAGPVETGLGRRAPGRIPREDLLAATQHRRPVLIEHVHLDLAEQLVLPGRRPQERERQHERETAGQTARRHRAERPRARGVRRHPPSPPSRA